MFRLSERYRFRIFRLKIVNLTNVAVLSGLFLAVVLNGGRGAFVLLCLYSLIIVHSLIFDKKFSRRIRISRGLFLFGVFLFIFPLAVNRISEDPLLSAGLNRALAFISLSDGQIIDLEHGSSGRDQVYATAIENIKKSPFVGYGTFNNWKKANHPHNFFLDLAMQFGIPLATLIVIAVFGLFFLRRKIGDSEEYWLWTLLLYSLVFLSVSGSYLSASALWFSLGALLMMRKDKNCSDENA